MSNSLYRTSLTLSLLQARASSMGFFRPALNRHGVTSQQWRVIRVLHKNGDTEIHRLAKLSCILAPSLTGVLKRMEAQGVIIRRRSVSDQRCMVVQLLPKGTELFEVMEREIDTGYERLESELGKDNLLTLMSLLEDLAKINPADE
ncbi:homoprotocatechuate degradation operon regulator HpaR [Pseudomonas fulva]|uniref:homoprotocatechuate degradation operon regulator HpaR n=1 Tax=Pseudomonas fulva TaxID=47880 RepID=UPI003EE9C9CE